MYQKLDACPLCGNNDYQNYIICKDHTVSHESFAIVECKSCHLKYTNPRPATDQLAQYYQSENYISHANKANSLMNIGYKIVRSFTLKSKLRVIEQHRKSKKKRLLDVGCGTGEFLATARRADWEIQGIEPSSLARSQASNITGVPIREGLKDLDSAEKFTTISLWHALEHVEDLSSTVEQLSGLLSNNGTLLIAVPNPLSLDAQIYKEYWAGYDVPRHLYHFTQETMGGLLKKHGFKIADTLPMKWDAYYVSLLSEKYKTGRSRYFKSVINGYKSNSYANKHGNNFSSLIYIAHK